MWPIKRRKQLAQLQSMIRECLSINSGNQIVERLQLIEKLASELSHGEIDDPSFYRWIEAEAMNGGDRA